MRNLNASNEDEPSSIVRDWYAIAYKDKDGKTIGNFSKHVSKQMHFFIKYGGRVEIKVSGKRRYSKDLQQGALEILYMFSVLSEHKK